MFLTHGVLINAVLLVAGIAWCVCIIKRFPNDISELYELYRKYKTRNDPDVLGTMRTEERQRYYQEDCATKFWTTLVVHATFFWPVTAIVLFLTLRFIIIGIIVPILNSFK